MKELKSAGPFWAFLENNGVTFQDLCNPDYTKYPDRSFDEAVFGQASNNQETFEMLKYWFGPEYAEAAQMQFQDALHKVFSNWENYRSEVLKAVSIAANSGKTLIPVNDLVNYFREPKNIVKEFNDLKFDISSDANILTWLDMVLKRGGPGAYNAAKETVMQLNEAAKQGLDVGNVIKSGSGGPAVGGDGMGPAWEARQKNKFLVYILAIFVLILILK